MNRRVALAPVCILGLLLLTRAAVACLWDYDTIMQERSRFPTALELITGKFLRHSPEFYRWRIADREAKLKVDPNNLAYYDDLAVAYSKTGDHAKAIELMLEKDRKMPGLYETYANLGTFYIFTDDLDQSLAFINKALDINPNAHFGREKYQKYLVEYLLSKNKDNGASAPMADGRFDDGFESFLEKSALRFKQRNIEQRKEAIRAVLGMMRFADYQNPILLEALADLLDASVLTQIDAKQLAARAHLKASYQSADQKKRAEFRDHAKTALHMQHGGGVGQQLSLNDLEKAFQIELAEADAWYARLRADELKWIQVGKNPEVEFAKRYAADPQIEFDASPLIRRNSFWLSVLIPLAAILSCWLIYRWRHSSGA